MALLNVTCLLGVETLLPGSLVGQKRRDLALAPRRLTWARLSRGGLGPPARPLTVPLLRSPVVSHGNPRPPAPSSVVEWGPLPAARGGLPPFHGLCPDREPGSGSTYSPGSGPPRSQLHPSLSQSGARALVSHTPGVLRSPPHAPRLWAGVAVPVGLLRSPPHAPRLWAGVAVPVSGHCHSEPTDKGAHTQMLISHFWRPGVQGQGPGQLGFW